MFLSLIAIAAAGGRSAAPATPAPATAPPPPAVTIAPPQLDASEWSRFYLDKTLPDPRVAFSESLVAGFGTGHFYADDRTMGYIHAGAQGGGLLLGGVGALLLTQAPLGDTPRIAARTAGGVIGTAAVIFVVDRIIDFATAPAAAHRKAAREIDAAALKARAAAESAP